MEKSRLRKWHEDVERARLAQERRAAAASHNSLRRHSRTPNLRRNIDRCRPIITFDPTHQPGLGSRPKSTLLPNHPNACPIEADKEHPLRDELGGGAGREAATATAAGEQTSAGKRSSADEQAPEISERSKQPIIVLDQAGADGQQTGQSSPERIDEPLMVGVGRHGHYANADPKFIREKLENEINGPGAFNFYGGNGLDVPHPLEQYLSRVSSMASNLSGTTSTAIPPISYETPRVKLELRFQTQSSTTITASGTKLIKGFDVRRTPTTPNSTASTPSSEGLTMQAQKTVSMGREEPAKLVTCDEQSTVDFNKGNIATGEAESNTASDRSMESSFGTPAPWRQDEHNPFARTNQHQPRLCIPTGEITPPKVSRSARLHPRRRLMPKSRSYRPKRLRTQLPLTMRSTPKKTMTTKKTTRMTTKRTPMRITMKARAITPRWPSKYS